MYSRSVFIFLSTCFLTIRHVTSGGSVAGDETINETINDLDAEWPVKVIKCFEHKHVLRCFKNLLQEKTKTKVLLDKIRLVANVSVAREESSSHLPSSLTYKKLLASLNVWEKALKTHIKQEVAKLMDKYQVYSISEFAQKILAKSNGTLGLGGESNQSVVEGRKKKKQMNVKKIIPFLLVPGLFLAGIMPWVVPQIKMVIMTVAMMNQVAFSTALFSFVRGYLFDTTQNEHIFYVNHGYSNEKHHEQHHEHFDKYNVPSKYR